MIINRKNAPKIKKELSKITDTNEQFFEQLGYRFVPIEAGYISQDDSTIIIVDRQPYTQMVMPYTPKQDNDYNKQVALLQEKGLLETT